MNHSKPRYPLKEAFRLLGIGRSLGYVRIREGALRVQKDGRNSYVTAREIDRYVDGAHAPARREPDERHLSAVPDQP